MNPLLLLLIFLSFESGNSKIERIAGGKQAEKGQFPFFAQLHFTIQINETRVAAIICGASLILPDWILSAGHCYKPPEPWKIHEMPVVMGTNLRLAPDADVNSVQRFIVHENYTEVHELQSNSKMVRLVGIHNDIALGKLQRPYVMYKYVRVAYLPPPNIGGIISRCKIGTIVGIGMIKPDNSNEFDTHVLYAVVKSKKKSELLAEFPLTIPNKFYSETKWLHRHPLQGDSGGPFVCYINKRPVVYGLISSVSLTPSNYNSHVSIYEKVDTQMKFIINTIPSARMQIVKLYEKHKAATGKSSDTSLVSIYCFSGTVFLIMHLK